MDKEDGAHDFSLEDAAIRCHFEHRSYILHNVGLNMQPE